MEQADREEDAPSEAGGTTGPSTDPDGGHPVPEDALHKAPDGVADPAPAGPEQDERFVPTGAPGPAADAPEDGKGGRRKGPRPQRPHPYADEPTGALERRWDPQLVTLAWFLLASVFAVAGYLLQVRYGYISNQAVKHASWETWTRVPLFASLALLGFGFLRRPWAKWFTMVGWTLFALYWGLTARDLFVKEDGDFVNYTFAVLGVYLFVYLAYHEWLSLGRKVDNRAVRFLNITAFVAAGSYFLVDKLTTLRVALINVVGDHTKWMLDLFGQGDKKGLVFLVDKQDSRGPVTFFYPDTYCEQNRGDAVGRWCAENEVPTTLTSPQPQGWLDQLLFYTPAGENLLIVPVSIILACTAIQSIMLFVGLIAGTEASWKKKAVASVVVAAVVYVLNLVRNTGIIWFYGQGHASFWVMHNAIGKGGSLLAMLGIAILAFRYFPPLLHSLFGVLDLKDRDGPVERTLRIGRPRPEAPAVPQVG